MSLELRKVPNAAETRTETGEHADCGDELQAMAPASRAESLHYLTDMLGELKSIAERSGYVRLAAVLALAHREAQLQHVGR